MNSYADAEKFKFQSIKEAFALVTPGCYMVKVDLQSTYRSCGIHKDHYQASDLRWRFTGDSHYMCDTRLPFGSKITVGVTVH